jgi:hypothetical protein
VLPVVKDAPPVAAAYQLVVEPAGGHTLLTPKLTAEEPQAEPSNAVKLVGIMVKAKFSVTQPLRNEYAPLVE